MKVVVLQVHTRIAFFYDFTLCLTRKNTVILTVVNLLDTPVLLNLTVLWSILKNTTVYKFTIVNSTENCIINYQNIVYYSQSLLYHTTVFV